MATNPNNNSPKSMESPQLIIIIIIIVTLLDNSQPINVKFTEAKLVYPGRDRST